MLEMGRLKRECAAAKGSKVHDAWRAEREALVRRDVAVGGGGADRADERVVPVGGVRDDVRPMARGHIGSNPDGGGGLSEGADSPFCDRVEVVVVRRAERVMKALGGPC